VALRKCDKYSALQRTHFFQPTAVETLGPTNTTASSFFAELGRKISAMSGDDRESSCLFSADISFNPALQRRFVDRIVVRLSDS